MTSDPDISRLANLAAQASEKADWQGFARFCELRQKGLRGDALKSLGEFLDQAMTWPFEARLQFTRWLLDGWGRWPNLPQPLHVRLVVPTLREWLEAEPQQSLAHFWLGCLGCDNPTLHVERSLQLDPSLEVARETLVQWILADIQYNQHEMPSLYIHDPREDLKALDRAEELISTRGSAAWAQTARAEIPELRQKAEEWLAAHSRQGDFAVH